MGITYYGQDVSQGLIVSGILLLLLAVFYLFKKENKIIVGLIASQFKPRRGELKKDTTVSDWMQFLFILVVIVIFGLKLITPVVVVSDSMKPVFERGDMFIVQSISLTPEIGDIITFNVSDKNYDVSHRVIAIKNDIIITKGDNNPRKDEYKTRQKNVKGKAIQFNNTPIVIKGFGALFITDYSKQGVISKWGDTFTLMQQISAAIKVWGLVITIIALLGYILMMQRDKR
jgi:signal peptidase